MKAHKWCVKLFCAVTEQRNIYIRALLIILFNPLSSLYCSTVFILPYFQLTVRFLCHEERGEVHFQQGG